MRTLRLSLRLLILPFCLVGCASTTGVSSKIRTVATIGDKPLPVVTGEPGATVVTDRVAPERRANPEGRISGRVVDEEGHPVSDVWVRLAVSNAPGGKVVRATTDRSGAFTLRGLRPGSSYTVIAEREDERGLLTGRSEARALRPPFGSPSSTPTPTRAGRAPRNPLGLTRSPTASRARRSPTRWRPPRRSTWKTCPPPPRPRRWPRPRIAERPRPLGTTRRRGRRAGVAVSRNDPPRRARSIRPPEWRHRSKSRSPDPSIVKHTGRPPRLRNPRRRTTAPTRSRPRSRGTGLPPQSPPRPGRKPRRWPRRRRLTRRRRMPRRQTLCRHPPHCQRWRRSCPKSRCRRRPRPRPKLRRKSPGRWPKLRVRRRPRRVPKPLRRWR